MWKLKVSSTIANKTSVQYLFTVLVIKDGGVVLSNQLKQSRRRMDSIREMEAEEGSEGRVGGPGGRLEVMSWSCC